MNRHNLGRVLCRTAVATCTAAALALTLGTAQAAQVINAGDMTIVGLDDTQVKAAVGGLDLILHTGQNGVGVLNNQFGALNIDDSNSQLPSGGCPGCDTANESFATTIGEIRAFYNLNFPNGGITNLVLFMDMQQEQSQSIQLDLLEIILNPTGIPSPLGSDLTTAQQDAINDGFTGGTVLASTDPDVVTPITLNSGSAWADWAVISPINPFDPTFLDTDIILFHFVGSAFTAASETLFISGNSCFGQANRECVEVAEPMTVSVIGAGLFGLAALRRRRRA